jgi:hypothetical protein
MEKKELFEIYEYIYHKFVVACIVRVEPVVTKILDENGKQQR